MNRIKSFTCFLLLFMLAGCTMFAAKSKEFNGSGISVTLTNDFVISENVQAQFYVVSNKHMFMGNSESKDLLASAGFSNITLSEYAKLVLSVSKKEGKVVPYEDNNTNFCYAYYDATVEGKSYSYMLICMEGENKFYTMNLACFTDNFNDATKEQYMEWAKTIKVE